MNRVVIIMGFGAAVAVAVTLWVTPAAVRHPVCSPAATRRMWRAPVAIPARPSSRAGGDCPPIGQRLQPDRVLSV